MLSRKLTYLAQASARQWLPLEALRRYQLMRLRRVVAHAKRRVPLYRDKLRGFDARDLHAVEDLGALPLLERREVIDAYPDGALARPLRDDDVLFHTSGTTGRLMHIAYDEAGNDMLDAIYGRALFATGYRPWDRIAYFWWTEGRQSRSYEKIGLMRKAWMPSEADPERQLERLVEFRPDVIYNFPTSLVSVAKLVEERRPPELRPRIIICHGELMTPESQRYLSEVFACPVYNQYGAQEFNRMAWDCDRHEGMHVDADSVCLEIVRPDGTLAEPGEEGELVVTSLHNMLMPLIRYRIGDIGHMDSRPCACGRSLPVIHLTGGRMDDFIVLPDGRRVGPRQVVPRVERLRGFKQYRVIQRARDRVEVLLVPERERPSDLPTQLRAALSPVLESDVQIDCRFVDEIPLHGRGKLRVVERDRAVPVS